MKRIGPIRRLRTFFRDEVGGPLAEFALVVPFLLLLVFGMVEFGRLIYLQNTLTKSVQDAARYAARHSGSISGSSCNVTTGTDWATVETNAQQVATYGRVGGATPVISGLTPSDFALTYEAGTNGSAIDSPNSNCAANTVPVIVVTGTLNNLPLIYGFLGASVNLSAEHREMAVGL